MRATYASAAAGQMPSTSDTVIVRPQGHVRFALTGFSNKVDTNRFFFYKKRRHLEQHWRQHRLNKANAHGHGAQVTTEVHFGNVDNLLFVSSQGSESPMMQPRPQTSVHAHGLGHGSEHGSGHSTGHGAGQGLGHGPAHEQGHEVKWS